MNFKILLFVTSLAIITSSAVAAETEVKYSFFDENGSYLALSSDYELHNSKMKALDENIDFAESKGDTIAVPLILAKDLDDDSLINGIIGYGADVKMNGSDYPILSEAVSDAFANKKHVKGEFYSATAYNSLRVSLNIGYAKVTLPVWTRNKQYEISWFASGGYLVKSHDGKNQLKVLTGFRIIKKTKTQ